MAKVNLFEFSDLLFYAKEIGYSWNQAHQILVDDGIPPMYEIKKQEYDLEEIEEYDQEWSEDTTKIMVGFMKKNKLKEMTII